MDLLVVINFDLSGRLTTLRLYLAFARAITALVHKVYRFSSGILFMVECK